MPSRNVEKIFLTHQYYHVYNRGVNKQEIFGEADDYAVFLNLLKRYLGKEVVKDKYGRLFPELYDQLDLLAFCLMPNHFHLCFYLKQEKAIETLMRGVCTAYTRYFNCKYHRVGPLYQGVYRASQISKDDYLQHITRYIHLNPPDYRTYPYSSLPYYLGTKQASWVKPAAILEMFNGGRQEYIAFVADYEDHKRLLSDLKCELANSND